MGQYLLGSHASGPDGKGRGLGEGVSPRWSSNGGAQQAGTRSSVWGVGRGSKGAWAKYMAKYMGWPREATFLFAWVSHDGDRDCGQRSM